MVGDKGDPFKPNFDFDLQHYNIYINVYYLHLYNAFEWYTMEYHESLVFSSNCDWFYFISIELSTVQNNYYYQCFVNFGTFKARLG